MEKYLLSILTFIPLFGALVVLCLSNRRENLIKQLSLVFSAVVFLLTLFTIYNFKTNFVASDYPVLNGYDMNTFVELEWISNFHVYYRLGLDGLSAVMLLLTSFLFLISNLIALSIKKKVKAFFTLFLVSFTAVIGVFLSLDLCLFYIFFSIVPLPIYFLIGIWGGEKRTLAAIKFFAFMFLGSMCLFVVVLVIYFKMIALGVADLAFNIPEIISYHPFGTTTNLITIVMFWLMFIAFAVRIPIFPLHTWLPDAHLQAPTAISVILAGVLLKLGGYGLLRLNLPLFEAVVKTDWVLVTLALLALINIVYGALCALSQSNLKSLVAYSSISYMGYVLLGFIVLNELGRDGAIYSMLAHGISIAMLFALVGIIYERAHNLEINNFGGLAKTMPIYFTLTLIGFLALMGSPGLCGFVGKIMILLGVYEYNAIWAILAMVGSLITVGYILWTIQRLFFVEAKITASYADCSARELSYLVPLALACIIFGCIPNLLISIYK